MVLYLGCVIGLRYKVTSIALGCEDKYSTIAPFAKIIYTDKCGGLTPATNRSAAIQIKTEWFFYFCGAPKHTAQLTEKLV